MTGPMRRVAAGAAFFVGTCGVGAVGYWLEGWSPNDAIYMVVITVFGVGYGEVRRVDTPELRALTSGIIVAGYGAAVYAVGGFIQFVAAGEITRALGARRMTREIRQLRNHTLLCGYGRMGRILAGRLVKTGGALVVVDKDRERIVEAESDGHLVVHGDASDENVLLAAGVSHASQLATVLPSDSANVFVTLTATGVNRHLIVIARAEDPASESKLRRSGAVHVIMPAAIGADRIAHRITRPSAEELLGDENGSHREWGRELGQLGLRAEDLRLPRGSPLVGQPVRAIEIGGNHGFLIVGLRRASGLVQVNPDDEERLEEGDTVIALGHADDLPELRRRYELERQVYYRGAQVHRC
jgi:voltage-gated potassium channel